MSSITRTQPVWGNTLDAVLDECLDGFGCGAGRETLRTISQLAYACDLTGFFTVIRGSHSRDRI